MRNCLCYTLVPAVAISLIALPAEGALRIRTCMRVTLSPTVTTKTRSRSTGVSKKRLVLVFLAELRLCLPVVHVQFPQALHHDGGSYSSSTVQQTRQAGRPAVQQTRPNVSTSTAPCAWYRAYAHDYSLHQVEFKDRAVNSGSS